MCLLYLSSELIENTYMYVVTDEESGKAMYLMEWWSGFDGTRIPPAGQRSSKLMSFLMSYWSYFNQLFCLEI